MMIEKELEMTEMTSWEEMSPLEQAQCQFWDMYKDAYGVRPRGIDTSTWTLADFEAEFESLGKAIEREDIARKEAEALATVAFEDRVQTLIQTGAGDRATALRWIHDAEETNGDDEYLCFCVGLPYHYFRNNP